MEFVYNNLRNASMGHMPFQLNCGYHPRMLYKEEVNPRSQSKSADKLSEELKELMIMCQEISTMPRSFKNKLTIRESNPKAILPARKFS